jgi:hypothetical protein
MMHNNKCNIPAFVYKYRIHQKLSTPTKLFHPNISTPDQHYGSFGQN